LIADSKPKLKNHYRAHRLSFWLNLVPDLHRPGGPDIPASHHLLNSQDEAEASQRSYFPSLPKSIWPGISSLMPGGTAVPNPHSFNLTAAVMTRVTSSPKIEENVQSLHTPDGGAGGDQQEDGFAVYSTALSVTVAIGCSLLILNVLIFAGVYYQRDKQKVEVKRRSENGQMMHGAELELAAAAAAAASVKHHPDTGGGGHQTQLPPPEFADVLPSAHYYHPHHHHHTLPRPPPPPKMAMPPELVNATLPHPPPAVMVTASGTLQRSRTHVEQAPADKAANTATLKKANLHGKVSQLANSIDELRV